MKPISTVALLMIYMFFGNGGRMVWGTDVCEQKIEKIGVESYFKPIPGLEFTYEACEPQYKQQVVRGGCATAPSLDVMGSCFQAGIFGKTSGGRSRCFYIVKRGKAPYDAVPLTCLGQSDSPDCPSYFECLYGDGWPTEFVEGREVNYEDSLDTIILQQIYGDGALGSRELKAKFGIEKACRAYSTQDPCQVRKIKYLEPEKDLDAKPGDARI